MGEPFGLFCSLKESSCLNSLSQQITEGLWKPIHSMFVLLKEMSAALAFSLTSATLTLRRLFDNDQICS